MAIKRIEITKCCVLSLFVYENIGFFKTNIFRNEVETSFVEIIEITF